MRNFKFMDSIDSPMKIQGTDYDEKIKKYNNMKKFNETTRKYNKGINAHIAQELGLSLGLNFTDDSDDNKKAEAEFFERGLFDRYQERLKERGGAKYASPALKASVMSEVLGESR